MESRDIRDVLLKNLSPIFDAESLSIIDVALRDILQDVELKPKETSLVLYEDCSKDILEYLARKKSKGLTQETLRQYALVLKAFSYYVPKKISDVKEWDILKFLDDYERCRKIGKRRKDQMRVILNGFFRYQTDRGKINTNPMATIEPIRYKKTIREPLNDMEMEQLRYACKKQKERALLEFFFATGCRVSEVVNLDVEDIDFNNRSLKVCGKGDKERIVLLNAAAVLAVESYIQSRKDDNPALFVADRRPYQRLKKEALEKIIRELGIKANLTRRVYPHLIRHTTATYLLNHGMPLEQVQVYLGHENINTTRIYAKTNMEAMISSYRKAML